MNENSIRPTSSSSRLVMIISTVWLAIWAFPGPAWAQDAKAALDTYREGPVWQIMTFRAPPGKRETHLRNLATVWEQQAKLAKEMGFLLDYKILTKWPANPDDWNIMMIEIFPNMAAYDTFWENWLKVDELTQYSPEFTERMDSLQKTGTEWLGTVFAREVALIDPFESSTD